VCSGEPICQRIQDVKVLLLEAGKRDNYIWVHIPVGYLHCIGNPRVDWGFKTAADKGLNGRSLSLSARQGAGRLLVDQRHDLHARPGLRDYNHWRQLGLAGWGWDDVLPYFRKSEDHYAWNDDLHGQRAATCGSRSSGSPGSCSMPSVMPAKQTGHSEDRGTSTRATISALPISR
jgi:choline dehydrogenase-like flavoprotein